MIQSVLGVYLIAFECCLCVLFVLCSVWEVQLVWKCVCVWGEADVEGVYVCIVWFCVVVWGGRK